MGNNKNGLKRTDVAKAAEECFRRYGVHRTSMADVADALGVARQTLYRVFESRTELLEYIASRRITDLGKRLEKEFRAYRSLEEALVAGSMRSIELGHTDELLSEIFEHSDDHGFEQFLFRGSPEIQEIMINLWGPLIDSARAEGKLRKDLTNERIVEWIRNIHAVATIRSDYSSDEQRKMLEDFLVPSLVK